MCGRFTLRTPSGLLVERFRLDAPPPLTQRYNIAPTQLVATIGLSTERNRQLVFRQWGLIPSWADGPAVGHRMINARSDTVATKPSFRAAFKRRRCLIPADGYYEWQAVDGRKQPYLFHRANDEPFAFAGLWEIWKANDGATLESCTIITTNANQATLPIHDRMPVILGPADYDVWLDSSTTDANLLQELLRPADHISMLAEPVSTYVNNPRHEGVECVHIQRKLF